MRSIDVKHGRTPIAVTFCACTLISLTPMMKTRAELPPLIPREVLFGNPEKTNPQLSPDGARFAWIAPNDKNVLQVWVQTVGKNDAKPVTADPKRGIRMYEWA